jgi:hypothetical protein
VFFPGEVLLPKKKKTVNTAINTEMKMHSDLITFMPKRIMLEEVRARGRIGQNIKKKKHEKGKAEKKKTRCLFKVYN